jgi:Virulence-associated protein E
MLQVNRGQIETFLQALFRHTNGRGWISLRAFVENDPNAKAFRISPTNLAGGLQFIADVAEDDAGRAANCPKPVVFCPPLAIFATRDSAEETNIIAAPVLSVEMDQYPEQARGELEQILGPATLVVRSGGVWTDPSTGMQHDKLHLHWRLSKPASGSDIAKLKQAREIATALVGGDTTNVPPCHPIRWPGSWHRKAQPRLCEIIVRNDREIDLDDALKALLAVAPPQQSQPTSKPQAGPQNIDRWRRLNEKALANLSAWVPKLFPSAKKTKHGGYRVKSVDLGRGFQEDLSLDPRGIKYFGIHDMGDPNQGRRSPIDCVMEWAQLEFDQAADWLEQKLAQPQPASQPSPSSPPPPPQPTQPQPASQPLPQPQQTRIYMQNKTKLACNAGNVMLALSQEPELMNAFAYDEMLRTEVLLRPLFNPDPNFKQRPISDADVIAVQGWLQWFGFRRLGKFTVHDAISKHAREHSFHPVRDYLTALRWDGKERLRTWLHDYLGAEQNEYTEEVGKMFLIGMVARIFKPGCKLDYMMILESEQGLLKSMICHALAGEYFSDHLPDIVSKDAFQHLRGKWLIEVAELRAYGRAMVDHFKEFLTRDTERYRPPWGRHEVYEPRQCVFIGTTNKAMYLRDETGNRRFWPVKCGEIDLDRLRQDRDQLFAEAVQLFQAGVPWWPEPAFEREHIAGEQEARFEPDIWEEKIAKYLNGRTRTTILEVAVRALDFEQARPPTIMMGQTRGTPINRLSPQDQRRITSILVHLDWEPKRDKTTRWWQPKYQ